MATPNLSSLFIPPKHEVPEIPNVGNDFYRMFSGIGDSVVKARERAPEEAFRELLKTAPRLEDGSFDPRVISGIAAQVGYVPGMTEFSKLGDAAETRALARKVLDEKIRQASPDYIKSSAEAGITDLDRRYKEAQIESARATAGRKDTPQVIETYEDGQPRKQLLFPGGGTRPIGGVKQGKDLTAGEMKTVNEAEDESINVQATKSALQEALALNPKVIEGAFSRGLGEAGTKLPFGLGGVITDPERAKATAEWTRIMGLESVKQMSSTLKGATTDRELFEFQRLLSDPGTPADVRERTIKRMIQVADRKEQLNQARINQMRGRTYYKPGGGLSERQTGGGLRSRDGAEIPADAIEALRTDPALARQFDEKYGLGAARRAIGGQ